MEVAICKDGSPEEDRFGDVWDMGSESSEAGDGPSVRMYRFCFEATPSFLLDFTRDEDGDAENVCARTRCCLSCCC
jgi:hypothetical protein